MASSSRIPLTAYALSTGAPLAGLTPTWAYFKNLADGTTRTPQPTIRDDGGGAYSFPHGLSEGEALHGLVDYGATANPRYERVTVRYEDTLDPRTTGSASVGSWTYTDSPSSVPRDAVRLLLGDTDPSKPLPLTDNAVAYALAQEGNDLNLAASRCAAQLSAHYSRQVDTSNGALSVSASQRAEAFRKLAATLRMKASRAGSTGVFAGGLTVSGKQALDEDTSAVQPQFRIGQDDLPNTDDAATE